MSLKKTKESLIQLLGQADNNVIALSGKWGTGKTYLWNEVKTESGDEKVKNALYVSLFGLSSIDQVKRKLIETAIPCVDSHGELVEGLKNLFKTGLKAASEHVKALAAINDINLLLMAPVVLRNKLIVIDDIERKHEKLGIDEVLGFIDEYSQRHLSRFVLVLNDDHLSDKDDQKKLWSTFREKVIDQEIKLSTSAEEAFSIAIKQCPSMYAEAIKQASIICSLTNIRIVVKVIKTVNQILASRELGVAIQARVVPSIVLFSAIHYRGMDDGPDFQFALNVGKLDWEELIRDRNDVQTPEKMKTDDWGMLMQTLGIQLCDEFEEQLVEFLESGLFESARIKSVIDHYEEEGAEMQARDAARRFLKRLRWDHRVDEAQLVAEAANLVESAHFLDPYVVTELQSALSELPEGKKVSDAFIDRWIKAFQESNQSFENDEDSFSNPFDNPLHPKIKAEFDAIKSTTQANVSVVDACFHIIENGGWGTLQEIALRRATPGDFEAAIRKMDDLDKFLVFMRQMIKMRRERNIYDSSFGTATEHFVEACRTIVIDPASCRLAGVIRRLFGDSLALELAPQSHSVGLTSVS